MIEPEDQRAFTFTLTIVECRLISLAMGMLARAAYQGGDIPGMDMANGLANRFAPRTLKELAERG